MDTSVSAVLPCSNGPGRVEDVPNEPDVFMPGLSDGVEDRPFMWTHIPVSASTAAIYEPRIMLGAAFGPTGRHRTKHRCVRPVWDFGSSQEPVPTKPTRLTSLPVVVLETTSSRSRCVRLDSRAHQPWPSTH